MFENVAGGVAMAKNLPFYLDFSNFKNHNNDRKYILK